MIVDEPKFLHGFMQDEKWYEDLAHVGLGLLPIDSLLWVREWTRAKLGWPMRGQYPPGDPFIDPDYMAGLVTLADGDDPEVFTQLERVADIGRDELGYTIGREIRQAVLVGLLVWQWG